MFISSCISIKTFDFSTFYTTIPHSKLSNNWVCGFFNDHNDRVLLLTRKLMDQWFWVPYCDVSIKTMFGSSIRMLFAGRFVSYIRYMCLFAYIGTHIDYMGNMGMSYRRQGLLFLRVRLDSSRFLVGLVMLVFLVFYVLLCLSSVICAGCCRFLWIVHSWLPLRFSLMFI